MNNSSGRGSSSSSFGSRSERRKAAPLCKCGRHNAIYTSKTIRNPNRSFFGCPNFKEKKPYCNFFTWVDDATSDTMELEDWRINKLDCSSINQHATIAAEPSSRASRGSISPPCNPAEAVTSETATAASSGTRARFMSFMSTPGSGHLGQPHINNWNTL